VNWSLIIIGPLTLKRVVIANDIEYVAGANRLMYPVPEMRRSVR
jgi:hypothetical protein